MPVRSQYVEIVFSSVFGGGSAGSFITQTTTTAIRKTIVAQTKM